MRVKDFPGKRRLLEKERDEEMFQQILVAYDGSAGSKKAFETALQLAQLACSCGRCCFRRK